MRSEIRDLLPIATPETFWREIIFDQDAQEQIYRELGCLNPRVQVQSGDLTRGIERTFYFEQPLQTPGPLKRVFGDRQALTEVGRFDPASGRYLFEMRPEGPLSQKVRVRGALWVERVGGGRILRCCDLDAHVSILGLGGLAARFICKSNEQTYARRTAIVRRLIEARGLN